MNSSRALKVQQNHLWNNRLNMLTSNSEIQKQYKTAALSKAQAYVRTISCFHFLYMYEYIKGSDGRRSRRAMQRLVQTSKKS